MNDSQILQSEIRSADTSLSRLGEIWNRHDRENWLTRPELYLELARAIRERGRPFWVYEIAIEGLEAPTLTTAQFLKLTQTAALSLARTGASRRAEKMMLGLLDQGHEAVETLTILGRIHKDEALKAVDENQRAECLRKAEHFYGKASFIDPDNYYPLINRATVALLQGNESEAKELAGEILSKNPIGESGTKDYWLLATLGEAHLIQGNRDNATSRYRSAIDLAGKNHLSLYSMRKQARLILEATGHPEDDLGGVFETPRIAIFSGHRIDTPDRQKMRFPPSAIVEVSTAIQVWLEEHAPRIAYASAAPGADLLFCEAALRNHVELSVVLPFELDQFRQYVVDTSDDSWLKRFDLIIKNARDVIELSKGVHDEVAQGPSIYDFTNHYIFGAARADASSIGGSVRTLAVWDGGIEAATGGTADCIALWRGSGQSIDGLIDPVSGEIFERTETSTWPTRKNQQDLPQIIRAVLFADVVGFSSLKDSELPRFFGEFLRRIAEAVERTNIIPLARNNWGDAYYLVFETASDACTFALALQDATLASDWIPEKRSKPLLFRIALNAGPTFKVTEPVCDLVSYVGQATNRAARIEPIVDEGQIFVSEYLAALLMVEKPEGLALDYVGKKQLPKDYGISRVFALRRMGVL